MRMLSTTFALPYESSLGVKPVLVGWCPECQCVEDPYPGPHTRCWFEHEWKEWAYRKYGDGEARMQRKRLMYRCPRHDDCDFYYLTLMGLIEHEHGYV